MLNLPYLRAMNDETMTVTASHTLPAWTVGSLRDSETIVYADEPSDGQTLMVIHDSLARSYAVFVEGYECGWCPDTVPLTDIVRDAVISGWSR